MCDDNTEKENEQYLRRHPELTRREFHQLAAGAALSMMLPASANAQEVTGRDVEITTADGTVDAYFVHPVQGSHPGVLMWPDIRGLRPAFRSMADRLASVGYAVLVVNPFYRHVRAPLQIDDDFWNRVRPMREALTAEANRTDATAFISWLDQQVAVDTKRGVGTLGYCMGGPIVMRTAAAVPDRIAAAATFHGGGLATDAADSPHLLIPDMKSRFLIAIAENDDEKEPEAKNILRSAFDKAGLKAEIEVYEDAIHGWCPPDSGVYHEAQAERAWGRLLALLEPL